MPVELEQTDSCALQCVTEFEIVVFTALVEDVYMLESIHQDRLLIVRKDRATMPGCPAELLGRV